MKPYPEDNWVWSPQGVVNMHYPEMWGYVQFSKESVGTGSVSFIEHSDEQAKWYLRQVYYAERAYFDSNHTYTSVLGALHLPAKSVPGFALPVFLECTTDLFEASLACMDGGATYHIRQDGLVWVSRASGEKK